MIAIWMVWLSSIRERSMSPDAHYLRAINHTESDGYILHKLFASVKIDCILFKNTIFPLMCSALDRQKNYIHPIDSTDHVVYY